MEYGAQTLEDPQIEVEVPKELQEGPTALDPSQMLGATALDESGQDANGWKESEGQANQPEIQEGQQVAWSLARVVLRCAALCCAVLCCAVQLHTWAADGNAHNTFDTTVSKRSYVLLIHRLCSFIGCAP